MSSAGSLDELWADHHGRWRDPGQALAAWDAVPVDPKLLAARVTGDWWETLDRLEITLLLTREYEHLLLSLSAPQGRPTLGYLPLPHPSGIAVDRARHRVAVASTRNPNQVFELAPVPNALSRDDIPAPRLDGPPLLPVRSTIYPGAMYLHDLAYIGGDLHANSVGQNAIAAMPREGGHRLVWWPRSVEREGRPDISRNYLQLNSIAAGETLETSFFTASTDRVSRRRPGHLNFPVDRRGVLFSGATRETIVRGLTRPHSARLYQGRVFIDDSGYGRLVVAEGDELHEIATLPGWTRGLCVQEGIAFVGTSRVIPRYAHYAPGLVPGRSRCGIHAVDLRSGRTLGSLVWPSGNQIFAIDWIPQAWSPGLPFQRGAPARTIAIFYTFGATQEN
jgi:uncharacterized protein (TIGR03032 family)